jgi:hypothetical protein
MNEKLTLTRALAEIKLLEKKIKSASQKSFIGVYQKKSNKIINSNLTIDDFEKEAIANLQSLKDFLDRKEKIKFAISNANATLTIKVNNKEMTIAQAIGYKVSILPQLKEILEALKPQIVGVTNNVERQRLQLEQDILKMMEQNLGKDRKADRDGFDVIAKPFIEQNELNISDKANIQTYVDQLEKDILDFESNIDFSLAEINAKTEIEI